MSKYQYVPEPALVKGDHDFASITHLVTDVNLRPTPKAWYLLMLPANALLGLLLASIGYLIWEGTGIWGLTNPVGWGWAIINFVWWVGIGHAGTLISAILFLFRQDWRTAINRFAEAMTIFAVMCALIFPGHSRRSYLGYLLGIPHSKPNGNVA
jgi:molybdopterin-containing oxidoreductase family membrane subunit